MELHSLPAAPLTTVGVSPEKRYVVVHHQFPVNIPKENVISGFMNRAQGFFTMRLTMPSNDFMGTAAIIRAHVPATENIDPPSPFNQTEVLISDNGAFITVVLMSPISVAERSMEPPPELFLHRVEEIKQIVALKLSFHRALQLADIIGSLSSEVLIRMMKNLDVKK